MTHHLFQQDRDYTIGWRAIRDGKDLPPEPTMAMLTGAKDAQRAIAGGRDIAWSRPPGPQAPRVVHTTNPGRAQVLTPGW